MVTIKGVTKQENHWSIRYRHPGRFEKIRTPEWATEEAEEISKGAHVRTGQTDAGSWYVQSILVRRGHGKNYNDAISLAARIRRKVEEDVEP